MRSKKHLDDRPTAVRPAALGAKITWEGWHVKIEFSKEQFRALLELVYLGEYMVNGIRIPGEYIARFDELQQYVCSLAARFGIADVAEFDDGLRKHFPSNSFDEAMQEYIGAYDNETFWEELIHRLAERDFAEQYGDAAQHFVPEDRFARISPLIERYEEEAEKHGIDRLRTVEV